MERPIICIQCFRHPSSPSLTVVLFGKFPHGIQLSISTSSKESSLKIPLNLPGYNKIFKQYPAFEETKQLTIFHNKKQQRIRFKYKDKPEKEHVPTDFFPIKHSFTWRVSPVSDAGLVGYATLHGLVEIRRTQEVSKMECRRRHNAIEMNK